MERRLRRGTDLKVVIFGLLRGAGKLPQEHRQLPQSVSAARLLGVRRSGRRGGGLELWLGW